jgi:hypothetical protein
MDLSRFFGKAPADILGIANDFTQFCQHIAGQRCDGIVARGVLCIRRLRRRGTFATRGFGDTDLRRREAVYADVIADRANDERRRLLPVELFSGSEPTLEAVAVRAAEVENDHDEKTGTARAGLTLAIETKLFDLPVKVVGSDRDHIMQWYSARRIKCLGPSMHPSEYRRRVKPRLGRRCVAEPMKERREARAVAYEAAQFDCS